MVAEQHDSVLLRETVEGVLNDPDGIYIDGTFGRGGHSRYLLSQLSSTAQLHGIDKDPSAVTVGETLEQEDARFSMHHAGFADVMSIVNGIDAKEKVSGIMLDLGVSSPQLDQADRGFSFIKDGPLDMRMNTSRGPTAADWLMSAKEQDIANVIFSFGEERYGRRIARAIIEARETAPLTGTLQLARIIEQAVPKKERHKHPATRSFQAIRIHINGELDELKRVLEDALLCLKPGGHLAIISFHSLEDRMVKQFFAEQVRGVELPRGLPVKEGSYGQTMKHVVKRLRPNDEEVGINPRARSATLRVAARL